MTVARLTPHPPPQVEFQLTVTAEELAVIKMAVGRIASAGSSYRAAIKSEELYRSVKGDTWHSQIHGTIHIEDAALVRATCIIAEAN